MMSTDVVTYCTDSTSVSGDARPVDSTGAQAHTGSRALLLEAIHPCAEARLCDAGWVVETAPHVLTGGDLIRRLGGVELLGIRSGTQISAENLDAAPDLAAVGAFCIGTNQVDLSAAAERGIAVFNAPFSSTRSVVELALAEIIALARRLTLVNHTLHGGQWRKSGSGTHEVRGRCLGIVGYGNIGSQLSVLAESLGMRVLFHDVADKLARGTARGCGTLEELLAESDIVSVHVDGRQDNAELFGEAEFARMRSGALFLNLSRGFVVDAGALARHLASGHLAGAAVDVFAEEPQERTSAFSSPLQGMPNVILTPHIAGSTEEAQRDIGAFVAGKLVGYARRGETTLCANLPDLAAPRPPAAVRLGHLHRNVPGVLAGINHVFADGGINIDQQLLATNGELGYVLTDVDDCPAWARAELARLPDTVAVHQFGPRLGRRRMVAGPWLAQRGPVGLDTAPAAFGRTGTGIPRDDKRV